MSSEVDQTFLQPFLGDSFDPAAFLNSSLPPWTSSSAVPPAQRQQNAVSLADLSNQTQTLVSQLNAQITRLSNTLTHLTDDILRSGGRLAYEVEVLRSDASLLSDALTDGLRDDIQKFLPNGLSIRMDRRRSSLYGGARPPARNSIVSVRDDVQSTAPPENPEYIAQLRVLTTVRSRLNEVIKVFGEATEWAVPPSEVAARSSLATSSSQETASERAAREVKGKEYAERVRAELSELLTGHDPDGEEAAFRAAVRKVETMRDLARVWKGTVEEKPRAKFVESLQKMVDEKQGRSSYSMAEPREYARR